MVVGPGQEQRVDRFISDCWKILTRSQLKARDAAIQVNGLPAKPSRAVKAGDAVTVSWEEAPVPSLAAEDIPLDILYEDQRVLVVDKAQGMVCHPANGNWSGTLVNAALGHLGSGGLSASPGGGPAFRPGIVHRLDKDTSGVIILAKDPDALEFLAAQFRDRTARKQYLAIVRGNPNPPEGSIDTILCRDPAERKRFAVSQGHGKGKGKRALTLYRELKRIPGYSLMSLKPRTGRTHQLRVHMKHLGCPILGDPVYSRLDARYPAASLMLHAYRLKIRLPGESEPRLFCAPIPPRFRAILSGWLS
jgi:23S rRNA pseudouridine1911/1915/1917 synthase